MDLAFGSRFDVELRVDLDVPRGRTMRVEQTSEPRLERPTLLSIISIATTIEVMEEFTESADDGLEPLGGAVDRGIFPDAVVVADGFETEAQRIERLNRVVVEVARDPVPLQLHLDLGLQTEPFFVRSAPFRDVASDPFERHHDSLGALDGDDAELEPAHLIP